MRLRGLLGSVSQTLWDMRSRGETVVDFTSGLPMRDVESGLTSLPGHFAETGTASDEFEQLVFDVQITLLLVALERSPIL
jgi:hypothetical protein